jgi:hypothetical protein
MESKKIIFKRIEAEEKLYLLSKQNNVDPKEITLARGRLIRWLGYEYKLNKDPQSKEIIKSKINIEILNHKNHLESHMTKNKEVKQNVLKQVNVEFDLRTKMILNELKKVKHSKETINQTMGVFDGVGNVLLLPITLLKAPIAVTLTALGKVLPFVTTVLVQPVHLVGIIYSKTVSFKSPYNKMPINKFGDKIGHIIQDGLVKTAEVIRKI